VRVRYHEAGIDAELTRGRLDARVLEEILAARTEPSGGGTGKADTERYLLVDHMLEPRARQAPNQYTAQDVLRSLTRLKRQLAAASLQPGSKTTPVAGPEWALVATRHPMAVHLLVQEGGWDLSFGRLVMDPGDDPALAPRLLPFVIKLVRLTRARSREQADKISAAFCSVAHEILAIAKGTEPEPFPRLQSAVLRLKSEVTAAQSALGRGSGSSGARDPAMPEEAATIPLNVDLDGWLRMILRCRPAVDRIELTLDTGEAFLFHEQSEGLCRAFPGPRSGRTATREDCLEDILHFHQEILYSLIKTLLEAEYLVRNTTDQEIAVRRLQAIEETARQKLGLGSRELREDYRLIHRICKAASDFVQNQPKRAEPAR
jgi:hypothetical protein